VLSLLMELIDNLPCIVTWSSVTEDPHLMLLFRRVYMQNQITKFKKKKKKVNVVQWKDIFSWLLRNLSIKKAFICPFFFIYYYYFFFIYLFFIFLLLLLKFVNKGVYKTRRSCSIFLLKSRKNLMNEPYFKILWLHCYFIWFFFLM
jgi:hypothetical protein